MRDQRRSGTRAVVLGAGLGGLAAARVLADRFDEVTVVERDVVPGGGRGRRGVPQGRHVHGLQSGGLRRIEELFPGLRAVSAEELTVIADTGEMYRGVSAWLMCLWALKRHRPWAFRLARPGWRPLARRAVMLLSDHRKDLSRALWLEPGASGANTSPDPECREGTCAPGTTESLLDRVRTVRGGSR